MASSRRVSSSLIYIRNKVEVDCWQHGSWGYKTIPGTVPWIHTFHGVQGMEPVISRDRTSNRGSMRRFVSSPSCVQVALIHVGSRSYLHNSRSLLANLRYVRKSAADFGMW